MEHETEKPSSGVLTEDWTSKSSSAPDRDSDLLAHLIDAQRTTMRALITCCIVQRSADAAFDVGNAPVMTLSHVGAAFANSRRCLLFLKPPMRVGSTGDGK
jgi:hypothetical protein